MSKLDRALQLKILQDLAAHYPDMPQLKAPEGVSKEDFAANIFYLGEHGLVSVTSTMVMSGVRHLGPPVITAKGMDFLADDGGLSSILGVVTVKLHDDTIRQLLIQKVEQADGDKTVKDNLIAKIKELPAEALGTAAMAGLEVALSQAPNAISLLRAWLHI